MSFLQFDKPFSERFVPPVGDPNASICIIGEVPGREEVNRGEPFVGPAGRVLEQCLHGAQLTRADVMLTNCVKTLDPKGPAPTIEKYMQRGKLTELGLKAQQELKEELSKYKANIFVPLGDLALLMLTGKSSITKYRGYVYDSKLLPGRKCVPTIHPASSLRGMYIYRHYITHDLSRAREESYTKNLEYPELKIEIPWSFKEIKEAITYLQSFKILSVDIEIIFNQVSCVGFAPNKKLAISIPVYGNNLTIEEEIQVWDGIASILENPTIAKIGQNFIFDMMFLAQQNHIITRGKLYDTMIGHSLLYPDFPKGLDFLGSIYSKRPYWKDMVNWRGSDINKEGS